MAVKADMAQVMSEELAGPAATNELLANILDVLKRIDVRLQIQDNRIEGLEKTVDKALQGAATSSRSNSVTTSDNVLHTRLPGVNSRYQFPSLARIWGEDENPRRLSKARDGSDESKNIGAKLVDGKKDKFPVINKDFGLSRSGTWETVPPPSMNSEQAEFPSDKMKENTDFYAKYPPPQRWISTKFLGRHLDLQYGLPEAETLWNTFVGDSWTIPPDGRVELSFQQHLLERLNRDQAVKLLGSLAEVFNRLEYEHPKDSAKRGSFKVSDFDIDPNYEESGADYRAEFSTGTYKVRRLPHPIPSRAVQSSTAPWKRIIEIRGLSRILTRDDTDIATNQHQVFLTDLRDPWAEALPKLNSICPLFTHRGGSLPPDDVNSTVERALQYHQLCLPYKPFEERNLFFHITFYEFVYVKNEDDFEGELWKSGRLHSENARVDRRIRESACTIVVFCDGTQPKRSEYWTAIYLCPFTFDLYEKVPAIIGNQDSPSIAADMIEFTMRMVVSRWSEILDYFVWLIGQRDALADPDVHDSLLFDDDTFSRSRRYFWAINYLAELDASIAMNILQLKAWIMAWPENLSAPKKEMQTEVKSLPERLDQLRSLQGKLRTLRQEAFALRDGLFSASGVIESRAATRLGENVKLLTSISIFFLPLSFCVSIWSISDNLFSLNSLAIVATIIPLATYFIVFNLNNLVRLWSETYDQYKRSLVSQMKQDSDVKWSEQGKRFEIFRPKAEKLDPSDWMVVLFVFHKTLRALGLSKIFRSKTFQRKSSQMREHKRQPLDLSMLGEATDPAAREKSEEVKSSTAKLWTGIFRSGWKPRNIFQKEAFVAPPSV